MTIKAFKLVHCSNLIKLLGLGISLAAASTVVHGQEASGSPATDQPGDESSLDEVIVTARRREESLQDTPLSITAFSAEQLETRGVLFITDVGKYTPNVQFDAVATESGGGASTQTYIRGIGQQDYVITVEPGVGVYLDGVYIGKSMGSLLDTVDIEQVEVLRGPQGTLFGRNTLGGAISVTSKRPTEEFEGDVEVTVGDYDRIDGKLSLSGPLSDSFRGRLSLSTQNRDGHVHRVGLDTSPKTSARTGETEGNVDRQSGRIALEWDVTDNLMASLTADLTRVREQTPGTVVVGVDETLGLQALFNSAEVTSGECAVSAGPSRLTNPICYNDQYDFELDSLTASGAGPNQSDADIRGAALTLNWQLGNVDLKSITAYREVEVDVLMDYSHSPYNYVVIGQDIDWEQFSQEFQIAGDTLDGRLSYVAGLYYSAEDARQVFPVHFRDFGFDSGGTVDNESSAVFGQATYDFTEQLALTVGLRYTDETRRFDPSLQVLTNYTDPNAAYVESYVNLLEGAFGPVGTQLFPPGVYKRKSDGTTPMASLSYEFTDQLMTYVSYSEGFKGGGFSMRYFPPVTPPPGLTGDDIVGYADPETAKSYEIGMKSEFLDSRLRVNASLFYVDYDDIQVTLNVDVGGPINVPSLVNAGTGTLKGAELEIVAVPSDWLDIQASLGYLDAEYDSFSEAALAEFPNANSFEFPNAPELTLHIGGTATFFENERGRLFLRSDFSWKDDQMKDFANLPTAFQQSYEILDASLNYSNPDDRWLVTLGGTNLTDEIYMVSIVSDVDRSFAVASRPIEWYLRFKYNF